MDPAIVRDDSGRIHLVSWVDGDRIIALPNLDMKHARRDPEAVISNLLARAERKLDDGDLDAAIALEEQAEHVFHVVAA